MAHGWMWAVLSIVLGGMLGWGFSYLTPAKVLAEKDLYFGLDAYRAAQDRYVTVITEKPVIQHWDDYKNWQMEQLDAIAFSDDVVHRTLEHLRSEDVYWNGVSQQELRSRLSVGWRSAGLWHFRAIHQDTHYARQAVIAWSDVVMENTIDAVGHAKQVRDTDVQLHLLETGLLDAKQRQDALMGTMEKLNAIDAKLAKQHDGDLMPEKDVWELDAVVTYAADWTPGWHKLLNDFSGNSPSIQKTRMWIGRVEALITVELARLPESISRMEKERKTLRRIYESEGEKSMGLSANLVVKQLTKPSLTVRDLRPTGLLTVIGGLAGLLVWGLAGIMVFGRSGRA